MGNELLHALRAHRVSVSFLHGSALERQTCSPARQTIGVVVVCDGRDRLHGQTGAHKSAFGVASKYEDIGS